MTNSPEAMALADRIADRSNGTLFLGIHRIDGSDRDLIVAALRSEPGTQEPVAWRFRNTLASDQGWSYTERKVSEHLTLSLKVQPLYITPPSPNAMRAALAYADAILSLVPERLQAEASSPSPQQGDGNK